LTVEESSQKNEIEFSKVRDLFIAKLDVDKMWQTSWCVKV